MSKLKEYALTLFLVNKKPECADCIRRDYHLRRVKGLMRPDDACNCCELYDDDYKRIEGERTKPLCSYRLEQLTDNEFETVARFFTSRQNEPSFPLQPIYYPGPSETEVYETELHPVDTSDAQAVKRQEELEKSFRKYEGLCADPPPEELFRPIIVECFYDTIRYARQLGRRKKGRKQKGRTAWIKKREREGIDALGIYNAWEAMSDDERREIDEKNGSFNDGKPDYFERALKVIRASFITILALSRLILRQSQCFGNHTALQGGVFYEKT
ncbi:MAG: hypothetical protein ACRC10_13215 [Thermoguttaceae bacterium]